MQEPQQEEIKKFEDEYRKDKTVLKKAPRGGCKYIMSREEKRYRNRWNTESKPYKPTPKGKIGGENKESK